MRTEPVGEHDEAGVTVLEVRSGGERGATRFEGARKPSTSRRDEVGDTHEGITEAMRVPYLLVEMVGARARVGASMMRDGGDEEHEGRVRSGAPAFEVRHRERAEQSALHRREAVGGFVREEGEDLADVATGKNTGEVTALGLEAAIELAEIVERGEDDEACELRLVECSERAESCEAITEKRRVEQCLGACGHVCAVVQERVPLGQVALRDGEFSPEGRDFPSHDWNVNTTAS